jgi:putative endonuclease
MVYIVYIIQSEQTGKFYIGQTQDLQSRIKFHNTGRSRFTKNLGPWKLYASKSCSSRSEAMALESRLKNLKSTRMLFEYFEQHQFERH